MSTLVERVEVSVDNGATWIPGRITYQEGQWSWTLWEAMVPDVSEHGDLVCRAIDLCGDMQKPECKWNLRGVAYNPWGRGKW